MISNRRLFVVENVTDRPQYDICRDTSGCVDRSSEPLSSAR